MRRVTRFELSAPGLPVVIASLVKGNRTPPVGSSVARFGHHILTPTWTTPPYSLAILDQLAGALMRGKVDLAFLTRRIMHSRICRTRVQLALPRNAFSAARSGRPFAQSLKADSSE